MLLTDLLHLVKHIVLYDALMGVIKNRLFLNGILPLLFIPDGVCVGFEVDGAACILPALQNVDNGAVSPFIGIFRTW